MSESKVYTVSWVLIDEKVLKIAELDATFDIAENVVEFMSKTGLGDKKDFKAELEIKFQNNEDEFGSQGIIERIKEDTSNQTDSNNPTTVTESTSNDAPNLTIKEMTINGVSVQNKGIIFKEEDKVWYTLDGSIDVEDAKKHQGSKAQVTIDTTKTCPKGNQVVTVLTIEVEQPKESKKAQPKESYYEGNRQISIEAQASVNSANEIVGRLFAGKVDPANAEDGKKVKELVRVLAQNNFSIIQDLKKSKTQA